MPFYDLRCTNCGTESNIMASMSDKTGRRIKCPDCGSIELETVYNAAPYVLKGEKAPTCPNSHVCGAACRHA